jgi:hypothetical protein
MKSCNEAPNHFIHFRTTVQNFSRQRIKILRIDNAPELICSTFERLCNSHGIVYEKTVPDSPSQNGVAEQCNLTLTLMAHAMLLNAKLTPWFWPFAIETAIHIKNHVPHSILLTHKTPFEFWYNYKPDLSHLCLFGSPCTSRILSTSLSKFDSHGEAARFLGYAKDAKGYILWIPDSPVLTDVEVLSKFAETLPFMVSLTLHHLGMRIIPHSGMQYLNPIMHTDHVHRFFLSFN